jgi:hypothetical protein
MHAKVISYQKNNAKNPIIVGYIAWVNLFSRKEAK